MKTIVFKTHSFVDVITNSSTELFVTDGEKTLEQVKELLSEKWELFSKLYKHSESLDDILEVRLATDSDDWWNDGYGANTTKDDIIIIGTDDNSIPYEFFDVIEEFFNVNRSHLG